MLDDLGLPAEQIRQILLEEMELDDDQFTFYNQKWNIPSRETGIEIVLEFKNGVPYSSRSYLDPVTKTEVQEVNMKEFWTVGIYSRDRSAFMRKHEVGMALCSIFSQQIQEKYSFRISRINPVQDLSPLEATALLYRYDVDITLFTWYEKTKVAKYYEQFTGEVYTEKLDVPFTQETP